MALDLTGSEVSFTNGIALRQYGYNSNQDANNCTKSGIYTGSTFSNTPTANVVATLIVINLASGLQDASNTNYLHQIWMPENDDKMYFRRRNAGSWGKWQLVTSTQVN